MTLAQAGLFLIALVSGMLIPTQTGINTQLGRIVGHPILAILVSFGVGTLALALYALLFKLAFPPWPVLKTIPPWMLLGGIVASLYVPAALYLAPKLGALNLFALIIAGQLLASMLFDHFGLLGFPLHPVNLTRCLGVVLLLAGLFLIHRF